MGRIYLRPNTVVEEVYQGVSTACNRCRKKLKRGDKTVACYNRGKVSARFCSHACQQGRSDELVEECLGHKN